MHTVFMPVKARETSAIHVPEWTFADKFRKARMETGMDQRAFAQALELNASTVAAYETGRAEPRFRDVKNLAQRIQMLTRIDYRWFLDSGVPAPAGPDAVEPTDVQVKSQRFAQPLAVLADYRTQREAVSA